VHSLRHLSTLPAARAPPSQSRPACAWASSWCRCFFSCTNERFSASNALCATHPQGATLFECLKSVGFGILYPGPCGCPDLRGECSVEQHCICPLAWGGPACALCTDCNCTDGQSLNDCTGVVQTASPPPPLLPGPRYQPWDKYGWLHPLYNRSTITQLYIEMHPSDLEFLLSPANSESSEYFNCTVSFGPPLALTDQPAQIKLKGGASRNYFHKSLKLRLTDKLFQQ
jgi:hypothetical protein